jgi:hypothetical protein
MKVETHRTKEKVRLEASAPREIERGVRQLLADKVSGTMVGVWLLIPEYLRLGAWDLLCGWAPAPNECVEPRLALQLVNESALCVNGIRMKRTLSQKGFELANGLPFIATDAAIHRLLDSRTVAQAQSLQIALGKVRQTLGHFEGKLLAVDPHRIKSASKRQMIRRKKNPEARPEKMAQTFFCLDADTQQPLCFTSGSSARTVAQATPELLMMSASILRLGAKKPLVLADNEHYKAEILEWVSSHSPFDLLTPMPNSSAAVRSIKQLPSEAFTRHWAGYATAVQPYAITRSNTGPYFQFVQRSGERTGDFEYKAFLCTAHRNEAQDLSIHYPKRWHIEEFFNNDQALGWSRAGTMNLNIRYGHMSMSLLAQAACFMMRQRLGFPYSQWDAPHLAKSFFLGLDGDIRVRKDTIIITYYNAPNSDLMKKKYERMPARLSSEGVNPHIPWLYDFKLDFRFK